MTEASGWYLLGGVTLVSELMLPELPLIEPQSATSGPVNIRLGSISSQLPGAVEVDPDCFATSRQYLLRIPGIASYLASDGRDIVVAPEPGARQLDVRAYLLGTVFVILCHQRGMLPLHASAVAGSQGVVAFLGHSGQGKSSLAAHLAQRGFPVLADDFCLIDFSASAEAMVIPAAPWLKLWRNSLETLGRPAEGLQRVFSQDDKYRLPLDSPLHPKPIRTLVFLDSDDDSAFGGSAARLEEVSAVEAIPSLMELTHHAYVLQAIGRQRENFLHCSRVSSQAKAYRLVRPWGLEHMQSTLDAVQRLITEK
jgi:hypothetical protein